jgi:hypothetical protein
MASCLPLMFVVLNAVQGPSTLRRGLAEMAQMDAETSSA